MTNLAKKLHPARFTAMSGKMAALVGFFIGETYTKPAIAAIIVSNDGFVFAMDEGDVGYNAFIGGVSDLKRNWSTLLDAAGLTAEEHAEAMRLFDSRM